MKTRNFKTQRIYALLTFAALMSIALFSLLGGIIHAQDNDASVTPSFGDGKLKILGEGFKPNENVTLTVTLDSGAHTFNVTANAQGEFELDTELDVPPLSSVELGARGDQGSGSAAITSVPPALPLPQTGVDTPSFIPTILFGLVLLIGGLFLTARRLAR